MDKQAHILFWMQQAEDDWDVVLTLQKKKKNLQTLFFAHLVIEKLCKAIWIRDNESNFPPRTHNLVYLLSQTTVHPDEKAAEFLLALNRFQLEGRYPDHVTKMHLLCTDILTESYVFQANMIKQWLTGQLQ